MTDEQAVMLAALEQAHKVHRIPDESPLGDQLLSQCLTDTRVYCCADCRAVFTIEPDGECGIWAIVPVVD